MKNLRINITIPVFNEEKILAASIGQVAGFLEANLRLPWEIVIADNGSLDRTLNVAHDLARKFPSVRVSRLEAKGRGGAIKQAWLESGADVLTYMDVDLSTSLDAFLPMLDALVFGGFDLAVGSRLLDTSLTTRGMKREVISRCYNSLIKLMFRTRFSDAQCGFKGIKRPVANKLLPLIEDSKWFFDTELLIMAERAGCRIFDLPVSWVDDPDSRVNIVQTAVDDIRGLVRLKRSCRHSPVMLFGR